MYSWNFISLFKKKKTFILNKFFIISISFYLKSLQKDFKWMDGYMMHLEFKLVYARYVLHWLEGADQLSLGKGLLSNLLRP